MDDSIFTFALRQCHDWLLFLLCLYDVYLYAVQLRTQCTHSSFEPHLKLRRCAQQNDSFLLMYNLRAMCGFLAPRDFTSDVENYVYICIVDVITAMIVLVRIHSGHQIRSAFVRMNAEMIQIHKETYDTNRIKYVKNHTQCLQSSASVSYYVPSWKKNVPMISVEEKKLYLKEKALALAIRLWPFEFIVSLWTVFSVKFSLFPLKIQLFLFAGSSHT